MYMYKYMYVFFVFFNERCDNLYEKHNITKLLIMSSSLYLKSQHSAQGHLCDLYSFILTWYGSKPTKAASGKKTTSPGFELGLSGLKRPGVSVVNKVG